MRIILFLFFICLKTTIFGQITSSGGQVYLETGSIVSYTNPTIFVSPQYNYLSETWRVRAVATNPSSTTDLAAEITVVFTKAQIDSFTGSGTTETDLLIYVCEEAIIGYLEGLSENSAITFSH